MADDTDVKRYVEIEIKGEAQIAAMQPDDVLIVRYAGQINPDIANAIEDHIRRAFPEGIRFIIGDDRISFAILRPSKVLHA